MKNMLAIFSFLFMGSCCSIQIRHTDVDSSLLFQQNANGQIWLSSLNSAQQIKITKFEYEGDTLVITYKRGAFLSPQNVLPLKDNTKYLKCANKLYKIEKNEKGFVVVEINKQF